MDVLDVILRVAHIGSAIGLLGGALYALAALMPAMKTLDDDLRQKLTTAAQKRFYRIAHPAILLLLLSGFYQFVVNIGVYGEAHPALHGLLGTKILLALVIFGIIFAQTFGVLKGNPGRWLKINVTLGAIIVVLAAVVRHLHLAALASGNG